METKINVLKSVLGEFFRDYQYCEGIINLRKSLKQKNVYSENWEIIIRMILNRNLVEGIPLKLIQDSANLLLDENSDVEAYKWLNLMLINSFGCDSDKIIEY
jgi:hypothetical protein